MIKSAISWVMIALITVVYSSSAIFMMLFGKGRQAIFRIAPLWGKHCLDVCRVKYRYEGLENLKPDQHYIFMGNHRSYFDIFLVYAATKRQVLWMAKKELFKVPFLGWAMRLGGFIPVDRGESREALKSLLQAVQEIKKGYSVIIFPEGTRSPDGTMLPFKRGGFILANRTKMPIAPFILKGTDSIMPKGSYRIRWNQEVVVRFLPVIEPQDISDKDLMQLMRDKIEAGITELSQ